MKSRFDDQLCPVCRGSTYIEWGTIGFRPDDTGPVMVLCTNIECQQLARKVYAMDDATYQEIRGLAIWDGGKAGGQHMNAEGLADTPLGQLTSEQFFSFLQVINEATETSLKQRIKEWADAGEQQR